MREVLRYKGCFICGENNACGLKARFFYDGDRVVSEIVAEEIYEGYRGIFHGGIISALLDEVMIKAVLAQNIYAVTAEMNIKFIKPVKTGDKVKLSGRVIKNHGRLYLTEGKALDEKGETYAEATGKYLEAQSDLKRVLVRSID